METNTTIENTTQYQTSPLYEVQVYECRQKSFYDSVKFKLEEIVQFISKKDDELSLDEQINNLFLDLDFGSEFDIDASKIGVNDAIFFVNLLNENNIINYSVENNKITLNCNEKQINATNSLLNVLKTSIDTNKPIRLDFGENVTVILRMDRQGKIQTHFIPGNAEVEAYLKNNIPSLKQAFDEQEINYSYSGYSKNPKQKQKEKRSEQ